VWCPLPSASLSGISACVCAHTRAPTLTPKPPSPQADAYKVCYQLLYGFFHTRRYLQGMGEREREGQWVLGLAYCWGVKL